MLVRRLALLIAATAAAGLTACASDTSGPNAFDPLAGATDSASPGWSGTASPGSTASPGGTASPSGTASPGATGSASASPGTGASPTVKTGTVAGRQVLVDQDGRSLYIFLKDTSKVSTCVDQCATTWPPLTGTAQAGPNIDGGDLGTTTRPDGKTQVTYYDKPLYYYNTDKMPGDANGQGIGGVWYLVDVKGEPVK